MCNCYCGPGSVSEIFWFERTTFKNMIYWEAPRRRGPGGGRSGRSCNAQKKNREILCFALAFVAGVAQKGGWGVASPERREISL